jgi:hypothetical protein
MPGITSDKVYPHGVMARYTLNGCRCPLCTRALADYRKATYGRTLTVPKLPYGRKLRAMMRRGYSYKAIARAAGLPESAVGAIIYGRRERAASRIRTATAEALDAVTLSDVVKTGYGHVPAKPFLQLIDELLREGARKAWIATAIAGKPTAALQVGKTGAVAMQTKKALAICDYYATFTGRNPWQVLDEGRISVSTMNRLIDLLDTLWGEWIDLGRLVKEFDNRWGSVNEDTVRQALQRLLSNHSGCDCYKVRYVENSGKGSGWDKRMVFATSPYAREGCDAAA